jgi:WD40 repeat protein
MSIAVFRGIPGQASFSDRDICIYDWAGDKPMKNLQFPAPVRKIVADGAVFVLVFEAEINAYTVNPFNPIYTFECPHNPAAPCTIVERSGERLLAWTGRSLGSLKIITAGHSEHRAVEFEVADHPLVMVRFNPNGETVATASERGTLIRVFSTRTGEPITEFRRGSFHATISSISFSPRSDLVAVLSDKGTVHVFEFPSSTAGKSDPIRAAGQWKMDVYESSVVEFVSSGILALIKFNSGELEILRYASDMRSIDVQSKVRLVDVGSSDGL